MFRVCFFAVAIISALCFFACSQTIEAPSQDDDGEALYSSSSQKNNKAKSSNSKSSKHDEDDEFIEDDDSIISDSVQVTWTGIEFTGEKRDCDFSVDDSVWTLDYTDSNSTSISYITFNKTAMEFKTEIEAQYSDTDSCEQAIAIFYFTMMLIESKDLDAKCDNKTYSATGTIVDTTRTIRDKEDVYKQICN